VEGPAGCGKTSLLAFAGDRAAYGRSRLLTAHGAELEGEFAFGVVRQLLEAAVAEAVPEAVFAGAAAGARPLFSAPADPDVGASTYGVIHALYWLVVNLCDDGPLAIVVDDAHWGDEQSLRFLVYLGRRAEELPLAVIVGARRDESTGRERLLSELAAAADDVMRPAPLSPAAVARLARRRLGDGVADEFCRSCHAVTGGNPLYVRELLATIAAEGVQPTAATAGTLGRVAPRAVGDLVERRLARLDAGARRLARAAAVLDGRGDRSVVGALARLARPELERAYDALVGLDILAGEGRIAFRHALVRAAVEERMAPGERGALHGRAAHLLLASGATAERVASHVLVARPEQSADWVSVLVQAAGEARRRGAPEAAAVYLARALEEAPPPEPRAELLRRLGNCEAYSQQLERAEVHLRQALDLAADDRHRGMVALSLGRFLNSVGRSADAAAVLEDAAQRLGDDAAELRARLRVALIGVALNRIELRALRAEQLELLRRDCTARRDRAALLANDAIDEAFGGGDFRRTAQLAAGALATWKLAPDHSAYWMVVHALYVADDHATARDALERGLRHAYERSITLTIPLLEAYLAKLALARGDLAEADDRLSAGVEVVTSPHFGRPLIAATLAELRIEQGDLVGAADALAASGLGGTLPDSAFSVPALGARARLRAAEGAPAQALEDLRAYGRLYELWGAEGLLDWPWRSQAARAVVALGDREEALALADEEARRARAFGAPRALGVALRELGAITGGEQGVELLAESRSVLERACARLDLARTLYEHGALLVRADRRREGRPILREAVELASACGARALTAEATAQLRAGGGRRPRLRQAGVDALTPAERRVAQRATRGLTNREIAQELFVTEKTVEAHLGRAYRKLGIRSRWQLASALARSGAEGSSAPGA
jgi:DNA-binding CsgD family transcriptional regulator